MDQAALQLVTLAVVEVVRSQVAVGLVPCEHVVEGDEHGMADGEHRPAFVAARSNAAKLGRQVGPFRSAGDVGDLSQRAPHPGVAATCPSAEASTSTFRIARAHPRPGGEVLGRGEAREVGADRGDEHFGGAPGDAGDGLQERDGLVLSGQARFELGIQTHNSSIQVLKVGELLTQQEDMVSLQSANDRLGERVPLGTQLPTRQLGERPRVGLAVEQSLQDLPRSRARVCPSRRKRACCWHPPTPPATG